MKMRYIYGDTKLGKISIERIRGKIKDGEICRKVCTFALMPRGWISRLKKYHDLDI